MGYGATCVVRASWLCMLKRREVHCVRESVLDSLAFHPIRWWLYWRAAVAPNIRLLFMLQWKNGYAFKKISCSWACVCLSSFHASNHLTDFHEILRECFAHADCLLVPYSHYWQQVGVQDASVCFRSVAKWREIIKLYLWTKGSIFKTVNTAGEPWEIQLTFSLMATTSVTLSACSDYSDNVKFGITWRIERIQNL
jgi:hypothetical protein